MSFYIDVILPLPLRQLYSYQINAEEFTFLTPGMRVIVPFGKSKMYTAVVARVHQITPKYQAKEIAYILDENPVVTLSQLAFYEWVASYYMCSLGEVLKVALPAAFLLENETMVELNAEEPLPEPSQLTDEQWTVVEALQNATSLSVKEIGKILPKKKYLSVVESLVEKKIIRLSEKIFEKYQPKIQRYIRLGVDYQQDDGLKELLSGLVKNAEKQRKLVLAFFSLQSKGEEIKASELTDYAEVSSSVLKRMIEKGIFEEYFQQSDRVSFQRTQDDINDLTNSQLQAYEEILKSYENQSITLLHGVASSGKTEIYIRLIKDFLEQGKQVLYLLPEIGISVQLMNRLEAFFGDKMSVYHSKYSMNERVEVWNNLLQNKEKARLVVGVRSAVFLPFSDLGMIIVDEEHDASYKQTEAPPRFNAKDSAMVLAIRHQAKVLLGSATPCAETFYNAQKGKYGYVYLPERYGNISLPKIELIDLKDSTRRKRMDGHFSFSLIEAINESLEEQKQVILLQNRRGYAPYLLCGVCGNIPKCSNCDVSLTFHQANNQLRCHYCGFSSQMPKVCPACGSPDLQLKGLGTEQVEQELNVLFPKARIERMDKDTTRGKYGFQRIIQKFESQQTDILIGTQMVSKGLDFKNVNLVGIMNADIFINQPDFRAIERGFQLLTQIAGRAGRHLQQSRVLIQTYNPAQPVLQQVQQYQYFEMIQQQLQEREQFGYAPFVRMLRITFKHREEERLEQTCQWFAQGLRQSFALTNVEILGPVFAPIARIRGEYIKNILIKIPPKNRLRSIKEQILHIEQACFSVSYFRPVHISYNVDI